MRRLRLVSFWGMGLSLFAHLLSWTTPNLLHFALLGIPLHIVAMIIAPKLYRERAFPLHKKTDLRWFHHAPSWLHALVFLAILSLMFHTLVIAFGISEPIMYLIRFASGLWLCVYGVGYGYTSWAERHLSTVRQIRAQGRHRTHMRTRSDTAKSELRIPAPKPKMQRRHPSNRWTP